MNKFLVYTIIAILLGTVTMATPLFMFEQNNNISTGVEDTITGEEHTTTDVEPSDQEWDRSEMLATPEVPNESTGEPSYDDKEPEEPQDFEEKPLVKEFITNTMMGIEYLWGGPVQLETSEVVSLSPPQMYDVFTGNMPVSAEEDLEPEVQWQRVLYTMKDRKLSRETIS